MRAFASADVQAAFAALPDAARPGLLALRRLVLEVARELGTPVEEALRWGQPAYLAPRGATLRLGVPKSGGFALYVTCTTSLIEDFRPLAGDRLRFEGTRAVLFNEADTVDEALLAALIRDALTYHRRQAGG